MKDGAGGGRGLKPTRTSAALCPSASSHRCRTLDTRTRAASAVQPDTPDTSTHRGTKIGTPDRSADSHARRLDADRQPRSPRYFTQADMQDTHSIPLSMSTPHQLLFVALHGTAMRYAAE